MVDEINDKFPGQVFTFTMDNLNVHKNALVMKLVINGLHQVVYRAPYWAVDSTIEYAFNTTGGKMAKISRLAQSPQHTKRVIF